MTGAPLNGKDPVAAVSQMTGIHCSLVGYLCLVHACLILRDNGMDPAAALEQSLNVREIALSTLDERTLQPYERCSVHCLCGTSV